MSGYDEKVKLKQKKTSKCFGNGKVLYEQKSTNEFLLLNLFRFVPGL